jgi:hypothetical protein
MRIISLIPFLALPLAHAATLRVPTDYATIQRAIFAADAGDTIQIEAGTYNEEFYIPKPLTVKGAGIGKTNIIGPDRASPVIHADAEGSTVVRDLSFGHTQQEQPDAYAEVAKFHTAEVTLENLEITRSSNNGIELEACRRVTIRNVALKNTRDYGIHVRYCPEFLIENVTTDAVLKDYFIHVQSGVGTIKNVSDANPSEGFITTWGASKVTFESIDPKYSELMEIGEFDDSPGEGEYDLTPEELAEQEVRKREYAAERKRTLGVQQAAYRRLQKESPRDATREQYEQALRNFVSEHLKENVSPSLAFEASRFAEKFGIPALDTLIANLPFKPDETYKTVQQYYNDNLRNSLVASLAEHRAQTEIQGTFDLPAVLATWKQVDGAANPVDAAVAFYDMAKTVSNKADTGSADEKKILKAALTKEVSPFIEKQGYAALDELLSRLSQSPLSLLTDQQVRDQLTPQQKRAFAKFLAQ